MGFQIMAKTSQSLTSMLADTGPKVIYLIHQARATGEYILLRRSNHPILRAGVQYTFQYKNLLNK